LKVIAFPTKHLSLGKLQYQSFFGFGVGFGTGFKLLGLCVVGLQQYALQQ
jgi:hypothetical protein